MNTPVPVRSVLPPGGLRNTARMPAADDACWWAFCSGGQPEEFRPSGAPTPTPARCVPHAAAAAAASCCSRCCFNSCLCFRRTYMSDLNLALGEHVVVGRELEGTGGLLGLHRRRRVSRRWDEAAMAGMRMGLLGHRDAVHAQASNLPGSLGENVPRVRRRLLQRRRRRRAELRRTAVGAILPGSRQPAQRRLRRPRHHLHLGTRSLSTLAGEEVGHASREAIQPVLLVALALGRNRRLLLHGEEIIVQELVGEPQLRLGGARGAHLRHLAHENTTPSVRAAAASVDGTPTPHTRRRGNIGRRWCWPGIAARGRNNNRQRHVQG
ncbi:Os01g0849950, partial [Oryza sativa Japonica Group]